MDSDIRAEWTTELRSGKYKQGRHALHTTNDEYCCLGILCEIAVAHGVIKAPLKDPNTNNYRYGNPGDGNVAFLPREVSKWAGMDSEDGHYDSDDSINGSALSSDNDSGVPFDEIADRVERYF